MDVKGTTFACGARKARDCKLRTIPGVWAKYKQSLRVMLMKIAE